MTIGETIRKAIKEVSDGMWDMIGPKNFKLKDFYAYEYDYIRIEMKRKNI